MPLHVEQVVLAIRDHLKAALGGQIARVISELDHKVQLPAPRSEDYFIGEPSRYRAYRAPAIFVLAEATDRPTEATPECFASVLYQEHAILISAVVEAVGQDHLQRACWRMADAIDACLHDQDLITASDHSIKIFNTQILADGLFMATHRVEQQFRRDVGVRLLVKHWDLFTPLAIASAFGGAVLVSLADRSVAPGTEAIINVPAQGGLYVLYSQRFRGSPVNASLMVTWHDRIGPQSATLVDGSFASTDVILARPFGFWADGGNIVVSVTTDSTVQVSVALEGFTEPPPAGTTPVVINTVENGEVPTSSGTIFTATIDKTGNYVVHLALRHAIAADTGLTLTWTHSDDGTVSYDAARGTFPVGITTFAPLFVTCDVSTVIKITGDTSVASAAFLSAVVERLP